MIRFEKLRKLYKKNNPRVLLMLSGGKDSSASLNVLREMDLEVTAVHFRHRWGYELSSDEARRISGLLGAGFVEIDFTDRFSKAVTGYRGGRPCLLCKKEMYRLVLDMLGTGEYDALCIGDNGDDKTTINRMKEHMGSSGGESIYYNTYFGSELGMELPYGIKVMRPLLDLKSVEVDEYLVSKGIEIKKNGSTGDKYFEYSREGCPVQFHDPGTPITEESMDLLKKYDDCITTYAREQGIRASIHLPSQLIVTIPEGFENDAAGYLNQNGLEVDLAQNIPSLCRISRIGIELGGLKIGSFQKDVHEKLYERFMERLGFANHMKNVLKTVDAVVTSYSFGEREFDFGCCLETNKLNIEYRGLSDVDINKVMGLIVEVFRTRDYSISISNGSTVEYNADDTLR